MTRDIFDLERLPPAIDAFLYDSNPWWLGKPAPVLPPYHRWAFLLALQKLDAGLAPAVVLRGPRQVGKTTLQMQIPEHGIEPEVDFVLTIGERRIPMEVKYRRRVDAHQDTVGLRAFVERAVYNAPFGVLVTMDDEVRVDDPRILPVSLPSLLMMR